MDADGEGTLVTLNNYRQVIDELVAERHSQVFGSTGDSEIIEFASPAKAEDSGFGIDVQDTL